MFCNFALNYVIRYHGVKGFIAKVLYTGTCIAKGNEIRH